jgi:hypothetical protein
MNPLFSINTGWEISALLFFHLIQSNRVYPSPPTISVYIRRRRGKETKNLFFFFSEWFQMKSDCSTRTVYLITSFDESNSFKLKTKKKEWPTVFLIFQLLCSYSSLAKASSSKAHERLPNSLDNTLLWTMNNIFFCFRFFSRRWLVFQPRLYCCVSIFIVIIIIAGATTTVYLAFPYP